MQEYFLSRTLIQVILVCHSSLRDGALPFGCLACVLLCCYAALPPSQVGSCPTAAYYFAAICCFTSQTEACLAAKRFCQSGAARSVLLYVTFPATQGLLALYAAALPLFRFALEVCSVGMLPR